MKLLSEIIAALTGKLTCAGLFPTMATVTFRPRRTTCPQCGRRMTVLNTKTKPVATLAGGQFLAREYHLGCPRCGYRSGSEELARLVPRRCTIGYDVLVSVGRQFFLESRDTAHIARNLQQRNVVVSRSEVSYLARKFIVYLALLHHKVRRQTRSLLSLNGGYVLHLDGTCEGESPHLISVLDGITQIVLDNVKLTSENAEELIPFLKRIKASYGEPVAVVSDMGKGIVAATTAVFPAVPLFICHYHFLRNLGKEFFGREYDTMRARLKGIGIQGILRKRLRGLQKSITSAGPQLIETFLDGIETQDVAKFSPTVIAHSLIGWALAGKNQGEGRGFPFDQPHLEFYRRLVRIAALFDELSRSGLFDGPAKRLYRTLRSELQPVIRDSTLKRSIAAMTEKVEVFARLRAAMRITVPNDKHALNDNGELCDIRTIEKEVSKFRVWLLRRIKRGADSTYAKLLAQLDTWWKKLFCDPIVVHTNAGTIVVQPQRTDNILERLFRALARIYRKRNGFQAMEKALKAMLAQTPLVMNLTNSDYMHVLLAGREDLAQRFADIDADIVREHMTKGAAEDHMVSAGLKRLISSPTFPDSLTFLIDGQAS